MSYRGFKRCQSRCPPGRNPNTHAEDDARLVGVITGNHLPKLNEVVICDSRALPNDLAVPASYGCKRSGQIGKGQGSSIARLRTVVVNVDDTVNVGEDRAVLNEVVVQTPLGGIEGTAKCWCNVLPADWETEGIHVLIAQMLVSNRFRMSAELMLTYPFKEPLHLPDSIVVLRWCIGVGTRALI